MDKSRMVWLSPFLSHRTLVPCFVDLGYSSETEQLAGPAFCCAPRRT